MIGFGVQYDMAKAMDAIRGTLAAVQDRKELLHIAGRRMRDTEIPMIFRQQGPGWEGLRPPPMGRTGKPLQDTGRLRDSIQYRIDGDNVFIGTNAPGAHLLNVGGTVTARSGKWLAIPLSPPLTVSERRVAKPRSFSGTVVWIKGDPNRGYEGPGIYRKTSRLGYSLVTHKPHHMFERIFALVKVVRIRGREFLVFREPAIRRIIIDWAQYIGQQAADSV